MRKQLLVGVLLATTSSTVLAEEKKKKWPKGINPATLQENKDPEPNLAEAGFQDLFNGKDLKGWTVRGGDMKFVVVDGVIQGTCTVGQPNSFLSTEKNYRDFVFTTEFRWEVPGNSGVMFRAGLKEADDKGFRRVFGYQSEMDQTERRWTGGIYREAMGGWQYPLSKPKAHEAARAAVTDHAAWNRMTILAKGDVIKTWVNGIPCSHTSGKERQEGFIGLQVHSGKQGVIQWRNVRLLNLDEKKKTSNLFESGDFSGWTTVDGKPVTSGWVIEEGVVSRPAKAGDIVTKEDYENFELTFDWKISEAGNSGVKYRTRKSLGLEYQILDDQKHQDNKEANRRSGSLYDLVGAPDTKKINPVGEWNEGKIVADGDRLQHWLNGEKVVEIQYGSDAWKSSLETSKYRKHEGFGSWSGPILLQDHNDPVWFRNMRIRRL